MAVPGANSPEKRNRYRKVDTMKTYPQNRAYSAYPITTNFVAACFEIGVEFTLQIGQPFGHQLQPKLATGTGLRYGRISKEKLIADTSRRLLPITPNDNKQILINEMKTLKKNLNTQNTASKFHKSYFYASSGHPTSVKSFDESLQEQTTEESPECCNSISPSKLGVLSAKN
uniref:Uncharacterized protein n=1 Tax=Romanomermis culicivorax TaxID=13658 RepID=A0A915JF20_ROMCU